MKILIKSTIITVALNFTTLYAQDTHNHCNNHDEHGHNHKYKALKNEISKTSVRK